MGSFLQYYGGKYLLTGKLIDNFPQYDRYVDVFGGAASVLLAKPPSKGEIYNDIDSHIVNLFEQVRDNSKEFIQRVELTPCSREVFEDFVSKMDTEKDKLIRAVMYYTILNQLNLYYKEWSAKGYSLYFKNKTKQIDRVVSRLRGVVLENDDFESILKRYDKDTTFFYLDPPYIPQTRTATSVYDNEMSYEDHEHLVSILSAIQGKVMLSGYENELYDSLAWQKKTFDVPARAGTGRSGKDSIGRKTEVIWYNYDLETEQDTQLRLF